MNRAYDTNGNMTSRNGTTLTWDVENRLAAVGSSETYTYDGDGARVTKTVGGVTTVYVNRYYEKNLSTGVASKSYYLGGTLIATHDGTLRYVHPDSLGSSSVATNTSGTVVGGQTYKPFGETWTSSGTLGTDKKFVGQHLDAGSGLYYYGARYYDPALGMYISADSAAPALADPQDGNRYGYALNNPLRYVDPTGDGAFAGGLPLRGGKQGLLYAEKLAAEGKGTTRLCLCALYF